MSVQKQTRPAAPQPAHAELLDVNAGKEYALERLADVVPDVQDAVARQLFCRPRLVAALPARPVLARRPRPVPSSGLKRAAAVPVPAWQTVNTVARLKDVVLVGTVPGPLAAGGVVLKLVARLRLVAGQTPARIRHVGPLKRRAGLATRRVGLVRPVVPNRQSGRVPDRRGDKPPLVGGGLQTYVGRSSAVAVVALPPLRPTGLGAVLANAVRLRDVSSATFADILMSNV